MIFIVFIIIALIALYFFLLFIYGEKYIKYSTNNGFQKQIIYYRGKSGFYKKIHLVFLFFLFGLLISYGFYWNWYNNNPAQKLSLEINNIGDFIVNDTSIISKNQDLILQVSKIKNANNYEKSFFSSHSIYSFFNERGDFIGWILSFYGFFTIIIGFYEWSKFEKFSLLFQKSKDKVKILNKFSSSNLFNENSIYENIIDLLDRVSTEATAKQNSKIHLKMLLCSPLLDKNTNNYKDWGNEFIAKIRSIATIGNIEMKLFHLPNEVISGVNPLRNFTEVLANYAAKNSKIDELVAFANIWSSTKKNINTLENLSSHSNGKFTINETKLDDIPFQIIISKSPLLEEVIVFFAGKNNLENEIVTEEPKGFHSVDPVVVEAFDKIFNDYVSFKQRVPIRPEHTQSIIEKIKQSTTETQCTNYLNSTKDDIFKNSIPGINITIGEKTFSPVIANSSKFTSRVIQETIRKNDNFLEIGAGSGVQIIVAYKMQQKLGNLSPRAFAIENSDTAFDYLVKNCINNSIYSLDSTNNRADGAYLFKIDFAEISSQIQIIKQNLNQNKFTYIVADLPFVDTKINDNDKDLESAFFDKEHKLQNSLLKFFAENNEIIDYKARLITSFSSLGGDLDILTFEMMINKYNLRTIKKVAFIENGYEWITYIIMRENAFVNHRYNVSDRFWWDELNVKS